MEIGDERRVHWPTRAMRDDQAGLTFTRVGKRGIDDSEMIALGGNNL